MSLLIKLKQFYQMHRAAYRLHHYRRCIKKTPDNTLENMQLLLEVLAGYDFPPRYSVDFKSLQLQAKVTDIMTLADIVEEAYNNFIDHSQIQFNRRLIASSPIAYPVVEWLWRALQLEDMTIDTLVKKLISQLSIMASEQYGKDNIPIGERYRVRALRPLMQQFYILVEVIEVIYLTQDK